MGNISQKYIIGGLGLVIVILLVLTFVLSDGVNIFDRFSPSPTQAPSPVPTGPLPTPTPISGDTIMYDGFVFAPSPLSLKVGDVINIFNFSDLPVTITTDDNTEDGKKLNLGMIEAGDVSQFVEFRNPGVYEFYNSQNPDQMGRIIVSGDE